MTTILRGIDEARAALAAWRASRPGARLGLVPTMGALHAGHLSLVERARHGAEAVAVSIFVNPLQFGPGEDFDRYPRTFPDDLAKLQAAGVEFVFAPEASELYPAGGGGTRVQAGPAAAILEGALRPGHFDGVLTVVAKLFHILSPQLAVFGQKDAQQLHLIRSFVRDLDEPVEVVAAPIRRDADGLALSSRNAYLSDQERRAALAIPGALADAAAAAERGADLAGVLTAAEQRIGAEPALRLDYLTAVGPDSFRILGGEHRGPALLLAAARAGATRLIDNRTVVVGA